MKNITAISKERMAEASRLFESEEYEPAAQMYFEMYEEIEVPYHKMATFCMYALALNLAGVTLPVAELVRLGDAELADWATMIMLHIRPYPQINEHQFAAFARTERELARLVTATGKAWPTRKIKKMLKALGVTYDELRDYQTWKLWAES